MSKWVTVITALMMLAGCTCLKEKRAEKRRILLARNLENHLTSNIPLILARLNERAELLDVSTQTYSAGDVQAMLASAEDQLEGLLAIGDVYHYELTPLVEKANSIFSAARRDLGLKEDYRLARFRAAPAAATGFARLSDADERLDRRSVDSALNPVVGFLQRMLDFALRQDSLVNLEIISRPRTGAEVSIKAPSYPEQIYTRRTANQVRNIFRGIYAYTVRVGRNIIIECHPQPGNPFPPCLLDLWQFSRPRLECDLDLGGCSASEGQSQ